MAKQSAFASSEVPSGFCSSWGAAYEPFLRSGARYRCRAKPAPYPLAHQPEWSRPEYHWGLCLGEVFSPGRKRERYVSGLGAS